MKVARLAAAALAAAALGACTDAQPCPGSLEVCGGNCVDSSSDPRHCGGCGRPCPAGRACQGGTCTTAVTGDCVNRSGGAFVVLDTTQGSMKLWTTSAAFVTRAAELRADPTSPGNDVPVLQLLYAADCDAQWSWHVDPQSARFDSALPPEDCNVTAQRIQDELHRVATVGVWCPLDARIASVDPR